MCDGFGFVRYYKGYLVGNDFLVLLDYIVIQGIVYLFKQMILFVIIV